MDTKEFEASTEIVSITALEEFEEKSKCCDKFKSLIDFLPEIVFEADSKGRITYINQRAFDVGGYTPEDFNKDVFATDFFVSEDRERASNKLIETVSHGKPSSEEYTLLRKDGSTFPAIIEGIPIFNGNDIVGVRGIIIDLTELKKREYQLFENQQKFSALFNSNPEAVIFTDNDLRIIDFNSVFSQLFGFLKEDIAGKTISETIIPKGFEEEHRQICQILLKGPVQHNSFRKKKDGSLVQVYMSGRPVMIDGKVTGFVMVYKDISDLVSTQNQLNAALKDAELLNEKLNSVGAFTRHDVRNKLAALNGHIYLSRKRADGNEAILKHIETMAVISQQIQRILDFEKIYVQVGVEKLRPLKVDECFEEAVSLHSDLKGVEIINELCGLGVMADSLLRQIFYNLVDNSLKYGQKISRIRVYKEKKGGGISLIYEDNGSGIEPSIKERLFQKRVGRGTGYGLYLIRRICDFYGWTVGETGDFGQGARFVFNVPNKSIASLE